MREICNKAPSPPNFGILYHNGVNHKTAIDEGINSVQTRMMRLVNAALVIVD